MIELLEGQPSGEHERRGWLSSGSDCRQSRGRTGKPLAEEWGRGRGGGSAPAPPFRPSAKLSGRALSPCAALLSRKLHHIFFPNPHAEPNVPRRVKTFQDFRNVHSPKALSLTCNLVSYHWFLGSGWSRFRWALCRFHGFNFR